MLVGLEPVHVPAVKLMSHQFLTLKNPDDVPSSGQCWSIMKLHWLIELLIAYSPIWWPTINNNAICFVTFFWKSVKNPEFILFVDQWEDSLSGSNFQKTWVLLPIFCCIVKRMVASTLCLDHNVMLPA